MLTIQNEYLRLTVDPHGAQMMELATAKGTQLLWNGDEKYWTDRAPVLFPFVGRLTGGQYRLHGKVYPMSIHGFAAASEFSVLEQSADAVTLALRDNEETLRQYPLHFEFRVRYALHGRELEIGYTVRNPNAEELPFGIGGHPGFRVPLCAGTAFEDYYLRFSEPCEPDRVGFTPSVFLSGHDERYPLENAQLLRLRHELFDDDAIILKNMARSVTLCSDKTPLAIKNTGARIVSYGAPVLPGAMFLLAYAENGTPIVGLPGCVMYSKRTIFDLVLPRLIADDEVTAEELAGLGEGGLCLNCKVCTFPNCGFGKGY